MSFRELRSFNERMRALGYPRLISMDSFRSPNFDLVAHILNWLVKSYDPNADIPNDVGTEHDRVTFMKSVAQFMASKANIKLNARKLYAADGYAVKELVKVANLLYDANNSKIAEEENDVPLIPLDITSKLAQLKLCRSLSSEITSRGAELYELLGKELELREVRTVAISRPLDLQVIDLAVKESSKAVQEQSTQIIHALENLVADGANLASKIEKKKVELERREKRLRTLQSVRPAFMDEFEKFERELQVIYATYMVKYRNLTYLEQQLDEHNRLEQDKFEETELSLKKMQNRLREEELRLLRGEDVPRPGGTGGDQPFIRSRQRPSAAGRRNLNSMNAGFGGSDESEDSLESGEEGGFPGNGRFSESDDGDRGKSIDLDGEEDEEGGEDDEAEAEEVDDDDDEGAGGGDAADDDDDDDDSSEDQQPPLGSSRVYSSSGGRPLAAGRGESSRARKAGPAVPRGPGSRSTLNPAGRPADLARRAPGKGSGVEIELEGADDDFGLAGGDYDVEDDEEDDISDRDGGGLSDNDF